MHKTFCIAGPIVEKYHYFLPHRLRWDELQKYIDRMYYFVLHAPRQSGKTTEIQAFIKHLNHHGTYWALYINIESAQAARDNVEKALLSIVEEIADAVAHQLPEQNELASHIREMIKIHPITLNLLLNALRFLSQSAKKPIALFIDEIDALIGDSLLSVLRQLRTGFNQRPERYPQSVCLIGLRDVRDYRVWSKEQGYYVSTSSPFNIKAVSLTLTNFTLDDVRTLYLQHTQLTGQQFTDDAIEYAYYLTQGQPWLVNALAYQACFVDILDRELPITKEILDIAKEKLISRQDTHLDSLLDKLNERRVRNIIDPIICGKSEIEVFDNDDVQYVRDLGLIKNNEFAIANPIYQEIIPRSLTSIIQEMIPYQSLWYIENNKLNMNKLLEAFTQFFRENSQAWSDKMLYQESMPHLLLMAFLQRIVNGGGTIHREYALGTKRCDIYATWKNKQSFVIELKIKYGEATLKEGIEQIADYINLSGAEGHLVIFDRNPCLTWEHKISHEIISFKEKQIHVWTM